MEVYKSKAVVVTGIGHETDRTLTDYVADVYCHTPTAAAERIIRGYKDVEEKLTNLIFALKQGQAMSYPQKGRFIIDEVHPKKQPALGGYLQGGKYA